MLARGEIITTDIGPITIIKKIGKGKSGYSYLAETGSDFVVFKLMHYEPCPYYQFSDNKVKLEEHSYKILSELNIPVPELLSCNYERNYLVKKYIKGLPAPEYFNKNAPSEVILEQLFGISKQLKNNNLNIDYFPSNFVIDDDRLYYIDYEVNPYSYEWSLENWGIYYWANYKGMAEYNRTGEWIHINERADSGLPIKKGFEQRVQSWNSKYGFLSYQSRHK